MRALSVQKCCRVLERDPLGGGEAGVGWVGDGGEVLVGDARLDRHRRPPTEAHRALVDRRDAHAHELVEPPVERAVPHRGVEAADGLREVGPEREGGDDLELVAVGERDACHPGSVNAAPDPGRRRRT